MEERLQKIIARAGVASRRRAEQLIVSGQVTVNGKMVTELGSRADASKDHIKVGGKLLQGPEEHLYLALYKPAEVVATMSDPEGRRSISDFLQGATARVYPVGRLEYHASGLLFLTNDGELANKILRTHGLRQTYLVKMKGNLTDADITQIETETRVRIERLKRAENAWYEVTLTEARRDPLRAKLELMGHPVEKMKRIKLANIELGDLAPGRFRKLSPEEISSLEKLIAKQAVRSRGGAQAPPRPSVGAKRARRPGGFSRQSPRPRETGTAVSRPHEGGKAFSGAREDGKTFSRPRQSGTPNPRPRNEHRPKGRRND
jgi:23S rRNA pseudouridine2605 synthase